jgi:hypothetical protein
MAGMAAANKMLTAMPRAPNKKISGAPATTPIKAVTTCSVANDLTSPLACNKDDHVVVAIMQGTAMPAISSSGAWLASWNVTNVTGQNRVTVRRIPAAETNNPNLLTAASLRFCSSPLLPATSLTPDVPKPHAANAVTFPLNADITPTNPTPEGPIVTAMIFDLTKAEAKVTTCAAASMELDLSMRAKDIFF